MASADGKWSITMQTQMGAQQATLTLATSGSELTGEMTSQMGTIALENGKVDGDNLTWSAKIEQPMALTLDVKAKVDGDNISGDVSLGAMGSASFTGTRA